MSLPCRSLPVASPRLPYSIGCPVWACAGWVGKVFTSDARRHEFLHQYSRAFNTVEGNSTFYGLPQHDAVRNWCEQTVPGFQFALKFPRAISHDRMLINAEAETRQFLAILEILAAGDRLGPSFLQLSPRFSGKRLPALAAYLRSLPEEFPFAVEVRHADYFEDRDTGHELDDLLRRLQIDRVLFETQPLFSAPPSDESEVEAQRRKPNTPVVPIVTGQRPMLRFVGRNSIPDAQPWIDAWAPEVAEWIRAGLHPFVFLHTPDDTFAPDLALAFHSTLARHLPDLPPMPEWRTAAPPPPQQRTLF